jgi:hypothetical protein
MPAAFFHDPQSRSEASAAAEVHCFDGPAQQPRRRFHECQFGGADETAGALAQDEVDGYDIGFA